jgi:hypothetical protein
MATGNGQPKYTVSISQTVRDRFGPWKSLAKTAGLFDQFLEDLKVLDGNLLYHPTTWGDPLHDLRNARLHMFRGMTAYLIVLYGVHFDRRLVLVKDIVLRPDRPLGQAESEGG